MLKRGKNMNIFALTLVFCFFLPFLYARLQENDGFSHSEPTNWTNRKIVDAKGGPQSLIWVVQLSDLHFSVHHPDRALQFRDFVGPALAMINPSLVLITGDLTGSALSVFISCIFLLFYDISVLFCSFCLTFCILFIVSCL